MRAFFALICIVASASLAQQPAPPDGGTTDYVSSAGTVETILQSIYIPLIPNAPFALTLHTRWTRPLPGGGSLTLLNHRSLMRDNAGRIFQERRLLSPPNSGVDSPLSWLQYADPATQLAYNCKPSTTTCYLDTFDDPVPTPPSLTFGTFAIRGGVEQREDLGRKVILGVDTHGFRITATLNPNTIGNSQPFVITREFWYSEQLGLNLLSTRSDPRSGTQTFTVTEITVAPQSPEAFHPPANFTIVDQRPAADRQR